ncbi:MAG: PCMD domain-containing protein [Paludibacteraceae bacterium]|nr:PCMD domain-containing protein [Paludibacteraceae bacterium]
MKRFLIIFSLLSIVLYSKAETIENVAWGNFDSWTVRYIKESRLLGGNTVPLYCIGPRDTIRRNEPYIYGKKGCIWATSNAYANPMGVDKASCSVAPERRDNGYCAKMESKLEKVKALGMMNITVQASGSVFTGQLIEPVKDADAPYQKMNLGVPFTKRPAFMQFDYKCVISPENTYTYATQKSDPTTKTGHDEGQAYILLQHRWEDAQGNVYAKRVGTGFHRFNKTQSTWENDFRVPIRYGDISKQPGYKAYEGLQTTTYVKNSKGKMVPLKEVGYDADAEPTHMIIFFSVGCMPAFNGHIGNTLWIDNVKLVYE